MEVTVISYPLNQINETFDVANTYDSNKIVQNLWVDVSEATTDDYIEITYTYDEDLRTAVKTLIITDECRYDPIDIAFQNNEGAIQTMTFFKAKKDTINIESEMFEGNRPIGEHQFIKFNVKGKQKFTLSSGFVTEDKNETIKQLLLSERVWMLSSVEIPLNVSTTSQEFKTRQNDRLINYIIEFEHAYYENNLV